VSEQRSFPDIGLTLATVVAVLVPGTVAAMRTGVLDGVFGGGDSPPHEFASVVYAPAKPVPEFTLTGTMASRSA
jgi:hypothetical protein